MYSFEYRKLSFSVVCKIPVKCGFFLCNFSSNTYNNIQVWPCHSDLLIFEVSYIRQCSSKANPANCWELVQNSQINHKCCQYKTEKSGLNCSGDDYKSLPLKCLAWYLKKKKKREKEKTAVGSESYSMYFIIRIKKESQTDLSQGRYTCRSQLKIKKHVI